MWRPNPNQVPLTELFGSNYWCFLVFSTDRAERLKLMFGEILLDQGIPLHVVTDLIPAGVVCASECHGAFVKRDELPAEVLFAYLRRHFGYECPAENMTFNLGMTEEQSEELDRRYGDH
jgi:hypothetical protein